LEFKKTAQTLIQVEKGLMLLDIKNEQLREQELYGYTNYGLKNEQETICQIREQVAHAKLKIKSE